MVNETDKVGYIGVRMSHDARLRVISLHARASLHLQRWNLGNVQRCAEGSGSIHNLR